MREPEPEPQPIEPEPGAQCEEFLTLHAGPSATAVELTAEEKPELRDPQPAFVHAPWVKPIGDYERRETTLVEGLRYG
jgi:hypothetical protein